MTSDLDPAVYAALTRTAEGKGRTPTAAHPDCRCGHPYTDPCRTCGATGTEPCHDTTIDYGHASLTYPADHHYRATRRTTPKDCPIHNTTKEAT